MCGKREIVLGWRRGREECHKSKKKCRIKNKYCILTHMYGIWKNSTDEAICRAGM